MHKKTQKSLSFLDGLVESVTSSPLFRRNTGKKTESAIQTEIRPSVLRFLEEYFEPEVQDAEAKAIRSLYWEGQEGSYGAERTPTFGARNYPDFIIQQPYRVAIEYKKGAYGSLVKQGIGQCVVHTLSGDFDFAVLIFQDEGSGQIRRSREFEKEKRICETLWNHFNVRLYFV